ncbi:glycosyl transferase family protein [Calothrix sp. NIES-4071]|nr:glycosyl transferase family protein [Calothrix sp. NIES-4071]BAZ56054.1 glycosyl transferase family protein [Calothrix sp. NIES-4105]
MKKKKVAAYITVYEDAVSATQCIQAIKSQSFPVDKILILDNSSERVIEHQHPDVLILHCPENLGIGYGLSWAIIKALDWNYDFIWVFDQDSVPSVNCLEILLDTYFDLITDNYQIGIIAPTVVDTRTNCIAEGVIFNGSYFSSCKPEILKYELNNQSNYECDAPITSGSLINLTVAKQIDLPRSDLFIDGIDIDYGWRLKQHGFHNLIVLKAIMYHNFGHPQEVTFLKNKKIIYIYSSLRHYYICRNHTYIETRYAQGFYRLVSVGYRIKYLLYTIAKIILFDADEKLIKVWACLLGTYHGLIGKLGKTVG